MLPDMEDLMRNKSRASSRNRKVIPEVDWKCSISTAIKGDLRKELDSKVNESKKNRLL